MHAHHIKNIHLDLINKDNNTLMGKTIISDESNDVYLCENIKNEINKCIMNNLTLNNSNIPGRLNEYKLSGTTNDIQNNIRLL